MGQIQRDSLFKKMMIKYTKIRNVKEQKWFKYIMENYDNVNFQINYGEIIFDFYGNDDVKKKVEEELTRRNISHNDISCSFTTMGHWGIKVSYNEKENRPNRQNSRKPLMLD